MSADNESTARIVWQCGTCNEEFSLLEVLEAHAQNEHGVAVYNGEAWG